jgi:hypothetical protein
MSKALVQVHSMLDGSLEPLLVRHKDAQRALGCGNSKYWELVKAGEIEVVGKGAISRADYASIKRYVGRLRGEAAQARATSVKTAPESARA